MLRSLMGINVHDKLFKAAFCEVEQAAGEFQRMLPPELLARLDLTTLVTCRGSFVDEALQERHTDILFSVRLAGSTAFLYVLFEHKSSPEQFTVFQLLRYMVRVWDMFLAEHPKARHLPAIVPLVVHHSESGWTKARAFEELFDLDAEVVGTIEPYLPRFRFLLDDLSFETDAALKARAMSAFGRLVLWCLRNARTPEHIDERIGEWADIIREVRQAPNGIVAMTTVWNYIFAINERRKPEELLARLMQAIDEGKEELVTVAEQLVERGRQEGLLEGLQRQRRMLLKLLTTRFGELPQPALARVNTADAAQLEVWVERVLTVPSLADVLADA